MSTDDEPERFLKPKIGDWNLKQAEQQLFGSVEDVPNYRLADKARRLLMDVNKTLSAEPQIEVEDASELDARVAQQVANVALSMIAVRGCGSAMALVGAGYVPEAGAPFRRVIEASFRARSILDDPSGERARAWLTRPQSGMTKLAQKYGDPEEIEVLSRFAHDDARSLHPLHTGPIVDHEATVDLQPRRDDHFAGGVLYMVAYEAVKMCVLLAETFDAGVRIPPWVSGQLKKLKGATRFDKP